jgi:hypothetical protein
MGVPPQKPLPVLVLAQSKTQLNELLRAAAVLKGSGRYSVRFCLDYPDPQFRAEMAERIGAAGIPSFALADFAADAAPRLSWKRRLRHRLVKTLRAALDKPASLRGRLVKRLLGWEAADDKLAEVLVVFDIIAQADQRDIAIAAACLAAHQPALLLVGEDGIGGNPAMITLARESGAAVLTVPYEFSTRAQLLRSIGPNPAGYRPMERILGKWAPQWIFNDGRSDLTALPPHMAISRVAYGLAPPIPWTVYGGQADRMVVDSEIMREHYLREGIPEAKLALVGTLALDDVYRAVAANPASHAAFLRGRKREPGRTSILCALTPDDHERGGAACEFKTYQELTDFWIDTLTSLPNVSVTFQAHPRMAQQDRDYVRRRFPISEANVATLVADCDILVTSISSIIRWAIAARKPVVDYDCYGLKYTDYRGAPGVVTAETSDQFMTAVRRLVNDEEYYQGKQAELAAGAARWGVVDGRTGARLLALCDGLTQKSQNAKSGD